MIDKTKFFAELDALGRDKIKFKVEQRTFRKKELTLVKEWFCAQPFRDFKTCVYHPLKPGKVVMFSEAIDLYQKGWVDGPHKFPHGIRRLWYRFISCSKLQAFLLWHDRESKPTTKWITISLFSLIGTLWTFPLGNFSSTGTIQPEMQRTIRVIGTLLLVCIALTTLLMFSYKRYKKYRNLPNIDNKDLV